MLPGPTSRYLPISANNATRVTQFGLHSQAICQDDFGWMYNLAGMSPCLVSSGIMAACSGPSWGVPSLNRSIHYTPPNSSTANDCSCSWSAYNLLSACTACQGFPESLLLWGAYRLKCPSQLLSNSFFPVTVSLNVPIPFWAVTDPSTWPDQKFEVTAAHLLFNQGHDDIIPGPVLPPPTIQASPFVGATFICGVVMGVLAAIFVVVDIVLYLRYRKTRRRAEHIS